MAEIYIESNSIPPLETVIQETYPQEKILSVPNHEIFYDFLKKDRICLTFKDNISPIKDSVFYKDLYRATVVFAVDRDIVKEDLQSWLDLKDMPYPIYLSNQTNHVLAAMAYGLGNPSLDTKAMFSLLKTIHKENRLMIYKNPKELLTDHGPISIIFDYEGMALKDSGRNMEIIIPKEGTLFFDLGFVSKTSIPTSSHLKESLIQNGFRLPDGSSHTYYSGLDYSKAHSGESFRNKIYSNSLSTSLDRKVFNLKLLGPVTNKEIISSHLILIFLSIFMGAYSFHRIIHKKIRYYLLYLSLLAAFWSCVKLLRYLTYFSSWYNSIFWYLYYVGILGICILSLWISLSVDKSLEEKKLKKVKIISFILTFIFFLLVLTNNQHHLVFKFQEPMLFKNYSYGFLFYPIFIWEIGTILFSLFLLIYKAITNPNRKTLLLPLAFGAFMVFYMFLYHMKWNTRISTDITFTSVFITLLFYHLAMETRLIPTNSEYMKIFKASTISMEIYDHEDQLKYSAGSKLEGRYIDRIEEDIIGGRAIRYEDRTLIHERNTAISKVIAELEDNYKALQKKYKIDQELLSLKARRRIISQVESSIEPELKNIDNDLQNMISQKEEIDYDNIISLAYRITIVKQRSNLLLMEMIKHKIFLYDLVIACHACVASIDDYIILDIFHHGQGHIPYEVGNNILTVFSTAIGSFLPSKIEGTANFTLENNMVKMTLFLTGNQVLESRCSMESFLDNGIDLSISFDEDGCYIIGRFGGLYE